MMFTLSERLISTETDIIFQEKWIYSFNLKAVDTKELSPASIYPTALSDEATEYTMNNTHVSQDVENTSSKQFSKVAILNITTI